MKPRFELELDRGPAQRAGRLEPGKLHAIVGPGDAPVMTSPNVELVRSVYAAWERGEFATATWAHAEIEY